MPTSVLERKIALAVSPTERARKASREVQAAHEWVALDEADIVVVMGGDGFMLQTLHQMLERGKIVPVYGLNLGTVGFLMNLWRSGDSIVRRLEQAQSYEVLPLSMTATTMAGERVTYPAINEVSLLRETRQTAKIEVSVNNAVRISELVCDGVLVATPAGSTAYNLSANGPILPLGCGMLALTPISPFRPRRWKGALLPDSSRISLRVLEPSKRPVSAVADQREVRDIRDIQIAIDPNRRLSLMFDPGHSLDDRISAEQFIV
ncbi:MAG: NAD kinase [Blastomonas fulva]